MDQRRVTSLDKSYKHGDLSVFPQAIDTKFTLFEAANNAETKLKHSLTTTAKYIIVEDASLFPESGLLKVSSSESKEYEIVFYAKKVNNQFHFLQRGYDKKRHGPWPAGSVVTCPVMAEHHNALKDAVLKIQKVIGTVDTNNNETIAGKLKILEQKWLSPKAKFKVYPNKGASPLFVQFQNFSTGYNTKFLWDFGDGTVSTEKNPNHTYTEEGVYTVKLNIISATGAKSFTEKKDFIEVNNKNKIPFFYTRPLQGHSNETEFILIDQTEGDVIERHWFFGDGKDLIVKDPNDHVIKHVYEQPGTYKPMLIIKYTDSIIQKSDVFEEITVF